MLANRAHDAPRVFTRREHTPMALTTKEIEALKPSEKAQKISDGGGLYVLVQPAGGKLFQCAYRFGGKQKTFSVGPFPKVSLAEARLKRAEMREMLDNGIDPMAA